jgi:hypothetical protein
LLEKKPVDTKGKDALKKHGFELVAEKTAGYEYRDSWRSHHVRLKTAGSHAGIPFG